MKTTGECGRELLRHLAAMPFLDRLEMVAISGWSRGAVYPAVQRMAREGLVESIPHVAGDMPPTRRYCLTAAGLHRLARASGITVDELLRLYPVSEQARRALLARLDPLASVYRLASAISNVAHPIRFRWYQAMPMDAAVALPDGRTVAMARQGPSADRTAFSRRMWRLREVFRPSAVLMLMPDEVRLRHARRLMAGAPALTFFALEREAASAGAGAPIWRPTSGPAMFSLRRALSLTGPRDSLPVEKLRERVSLPSGIDLTAAVSEAPHHMLPALLKATEKRALDLVSDWPWITPAHLGEMLGVGRSRLSQVVQRLEALGLCSVASVQDSPRLALSDRGLALIARRDRTSLGAALKRWSVAPSRRRTPFGWRNVSGRKSAHLLRNIEHTDSVHWFAAALQRQARSTFWEVVQLDPSKRASRFFRHGQQLRSVHPDAFGVLRTDGESRTFFLEWERRAIRPVTMTARIAPYLRYFSSSRPTDDHGFQPVVLVVFEDEIAQAHFLRIARQQMQRTGVRLPLRVSNRDLLEMEGPLGRAWSSVDGDGTDYSFR